MATSTSTPTSLGKVLVVGGCGFLGSHIVSLLHTQFPSTQISVIDLVTERNRHASPDITYHACDITSTDGLLPIFEGLRPNAVIHTASPTLMGGSKALYEKVNVGGTKALLEVSLKTGVQAFVYTSSASVISDNVGDLINADERWPIVPRELQSEIYSTTKADAEELVLATNDRSKMLTAAIRPAGILGEGDVQLIPQMLRVYERRQTGFQLGDNNNLFDFTYVQNAALGHTLAAKVLLDAFATLKAGDPINEKLKADGEAFFITNDSPVYFWDFPRAVWKAAGDTTALNVITIPRDIGLAIGATLEWIYWVLGRKASLTPKEVKYSCMTRYYNIGKAKERLGYAPIVSLQEGITRAVNWYMAQKTKESEKKAQ